jgi:hypothetical protein
MRHARSVIARQMRARRPAPASPMRYSRMTRMIPAHASNAPARLAGPLLSIVRKSVNEKRDVSAFSSARNAHRMTKPVSRRSQVVGFAGGTTHCRGPWTQHWTQPIQNSKPRPAQNRCGTQSRRKLGQKRLGPRHVEHVERSARRSRNFISPGAFVLHRFSAGNFRLSRCFEVARQGASFLRL